MIPNAFLVALTIRSLSLLLPHTFFQPDEFYQAFEPAYSAVFGHGFLTWEWRDLPHATASQGGNLGVLQSAICEGRLRSWVWPGVFMAVYKSLDVLGLQDTEWAVGTGPSCDQQTDKLLDHTAPRRGRPHSSPDGLPHRFTGNQAEGSWCSHRSRMYGYLAFLTRTAVLVLDVFIQCPPSSPSAVNISGDASHHSSFGALPRHMSPGKECRQGSAGEPRPRRNGSDRG